MSDSPQPYRVLARKYRPQTFSELIGQEAMVQTLGNAIKRGRLAHAFVMTGVRGVGKTSTARLIAKALNCIGPDGQGDATIDPCGMCEPCKAIAEGRHIDVVEMDAASHTGVDDVREIIEAVRYAAVSARYKIYIIDEVHMLSKNAFNALLKTLEEPPAHVKFLFATTEVNKIPVTILSRCQRFDLRRIPGEKLQAHFAHVAEEEGVSADATALALIASAAEGSARDGLSILDQAIAHAELTGEQPHVTAEQVRDMLGLADRGNIRRLLGHVLAGETSGVLDSLAGQYGLGVDPAGIIATLLDLVHAVTLTKSGRQDDDPARSAEEKAVLGEWSEKMGFAELHRLWQLLLKGHGEVVSAVNPRDACDMALLRIVHAASMPDPSELARMLAGGAIAAPPSIPVAPAPAVPQSEPAFPDMAAAAPQPAPIAEPEPVSLFPPDFPALVERLFDSKKAGLADILHDCVGLVAYAPPTIEVRPTRPLSANFAKELGDALEGLSGRKWTVALSDGPAEPTLLEQERSQKQAREDAVWASPVAQAIRESFPGAELIGIEPINSKSANA
ncbi:MAG TPA: DNA polymerase III subunit gamma/tau [Sphingobium sp.]|uniref:DNA polymerase III subunit gamma/tau n=1 Tax=Sphingobium sp. TaxID=1912891 RepID=UPI002ED33F8B